MDTKSAKEALKFLIEFEELAAHAILAECVGDGGIDQLHVHLPKVNRIYLFK